MLHHLTNLWPSTVATRLYLAVTFLEMLVNVVIMGTLLVKGQFLTSFFDRQTQSEKSALPVYLGLFAAAHVYQLILAAEGILHRNIIQIVGITIFNGLFLVYSVILVGEVRSTFDAAQDVNDMSVTVLATVVPIVIALTEVAYLLLSWRLWQEFGWHIFKSLGADRRIRKYYAAFQVFVCILKFDYFFFLSFSLQFVLLVLNNGDIERYFTIAAAPISLLILVLGYFAVKREHRPLTLAFIFLCCCAAGYFLFKLIRIYIGSQVESYRLVRKSLTVFTTLSMLAMVFTVAVTFVCMRNFGKGLRFHLNRPKPSKAAEAGFDDNASYAGAGLHYKLSSAAGSRLSID